MKGIDALSREQLVQVMAALGIGNPAPVFSMVPSFGPIRPAGLVPSITEEDRVILNNVQKIVGFLTAGSSSSRSSNQVIYKFVLHRGERISSFFSHNIKDKFKYGQLENRV